MSCKIFFSTGRLNFTFKFSLEWEFDTEFGTFPPEIQEIQDDEFQFLAWASLVSFIFSKAAICSSVKIIPS